jgi:hypothetical protein
MILHINHVQPGRSESTSGVVSTLLSLLEAGDIDPNTLGHLNVHIDWVQYKSNFREPVSIRRVVRDEELLPLADIAVDLRQIQPEMMRKALSEALNGAGPDALETPRRVYLESFTPMRSSIIWTFNAVFWKYLPIWEQASGKGYEKALPGGHSDGHNAQAIHDSVVEFWEQLRKIESQHLLPPEIYILEIGVGTGERANRWLEGFKALDCERGTQYYAKLRFLAGDYSVATLNRVMQSLKEHGHLANFVEVDAMNPFKSLSHLRYKVMLITLSNVYDNLPTDELVLRDGKLFFIEVRAYVPTAEVALICAKYGIPREGFERSVQKLLQDGPKSFDSLDQAMGFWRETWAAVRLEERLVSAHNLSEAHLPNGMKPSYIEGLIENAPANIRFQLSSGATESFINTIPLLHPRGCLQVSDIFVEKLTDYLHGFRGPGKMDGSIVNWVNGALLEVVGAQSGYDVHFAPFAYRKGSKTSILYTTQRE